MIEQKTREKEGFAATLRVIKRELDEINQKKSKIVEEKNDWQQQADTLTQQRDQLVIKNSVLFFKFTKNRTTYQPNFFYRAPRPD